MKMEIIAGIPVDKSYAAAVVSKQSTMISYRLMNGGPWTGADFVKALSSPPFLSDDPLSVDGKA